MILNPSKRPSSGSSGGSGSGYTHTFTAANWVKGTNEVTITIPAVTHGLTGTLVDCQAFSLISGNYRQNTWAAMETYATVSSNGDIVLHYPNNAGYNGAVILSAHQS